MLGWGPVTQVSWSLFQCPPSPLEHAFPEDRSRVSSISLSLERGDGQVTPITCNLSEPQLQEGKYRAAGGAPTLTTGAWLSPPTVPHQGTTSLTSFFTSFPLALALLLLAAVRELA